MSKLIKLTTDLIEECKLEFLASIRDGKFSDGKVTFSKVLGVVDRKAKIYFTETAWLKMTALIEESSKEVGWHGIAVRGEEPCTYHITDILVYPQEVTGSTVTTDQEKYSMWLMEQDDDIFNNIRMQGHSHVYMGTSPSSVDTAFYDQLLDQLEDDMFYIFMIWNKRKEKTIKIYDIKENTLFETADVEVQVIKDDSGIMTFLECAKKMVFEKQYVSYQSSYQPGYQTGYQNGYGNDYNEYWSRNRKNSVGYGGAGKTEGKKEPDPVKTKSEKEKIRKGKRDNGKTSKQMRIADYYS